MVWGRKVKRNFRKQSGENGTAMVVMKGQTM
jgi:hypothetical protein